MALGQAILAVAFMVAAEFIGGGRIASRLGAVAHFCYFGCGEELKLSHSFIIPTAGHDRSADRRLIMPNLRQCRGSGTMLSARPIGLQDAFAGPGAMGVADR
ncbi:MAG: hypothetical protein ABW000_03615 [Actinoplanes sp.]